MHMKKRGPSKSNLRLSKIGKRGQEGFSFTAILGLVVGIVALVMIALFVYNIFGKAGKTLEFLPGEEAQASQVCGLVAGSGDSNLVCDDFKKLKIGGENRFVNCKFVSDLFSEPPEWAEKIENIECSTSEVKYCGKQSESEIGSKGILVNDGICANNGTKLDNAAGEEFLSVDTNCFYKLDGEGYSDGKKWDQATSAPVACESN